MINLIAAVGKNNEIGKDNKLLWHIKEDMIFFKETTSNNSVVMGKNTYLSIGKKLPNRKNYVISKSLENLNSDIIIINNPQEILSLNENIFIIGGGKIYEYFLPYADNIYLTEIEDEKDADTFFPKFDKSKYKRIVLKENCLDGLKYSFNLYKKL